MQTLNILEEEIVGRVHSIETAGAVDGPGIRYIVFLQGCLMRCLYCHNRDTWDLNAGRLVTANELMQEIITYKHYMRASGGGVTASGGEPMLQPNFLLDLFKKCKQQDINTCIDSNGFVKHYNHTIDELMELTDLVLLDLKQLDEQKHKKLTGVSNKNTLNFARYLHNKNKPVWIRFVIVPGYTDDAASAHALGVFISDMYNIKRVELLPYHAMGEYKWKDFNDESKLAGILPPSRDKLLEIKLIIESYGKPVYFNV